MLKSRVIPCLLIRNKGLVKTVNFGEDKYVGDPINAVRIFNEKEVDELMVIDIDATVLKKEPDYERIKKIAAECRMPLCYGGGVKTAEQAKKIINLGAEKVAVSSIAVENSEVLSQMVDLVGRQSIVVVMDVKKKGFFSKYEVVTHNANKSTGIKAIDFAKKLEKIGIGELVVNSVDNDGVMKGYDVKLAEQIRNVTTMPLTILGGAGTMDDLRNLIEKFKIIGVAAGSLFVFKGKYRAVLIQYPKL